MQYIFISKYYLAYDRTLLGCINHAYFGLLLRLSQWFFQDAFYFLQWCYLWFHCLKNQSNRVKGILNMCDLYNPKKHLVNNVFPDIHTVHGGKTHHIDSFWFDADHPLRWDWEQCPYSEKGDLHIREDAQIQNSFAIISLCYWKARRSY